MEPSRVVIFIAIAIFAVGFIYMNFIFPHQSEKEGKQKLEEQNEEKLKAPEQVVKKLQEKNTRKR